MIRPFTCACLLLAAGSGLWLYHVKHKAQVLDRQIERTIRAADAARQRTTLLRADWALLNDPQRLQRLATTYLHLQPIKPAQFVPLSRLDSRLPPVPPPPMPEPAPDALVALAAPEAPPDAAPPPALAGDAAVAAASAPAAKPSPPVNVAAAQPPAASHQAPIRRPIVTADAEPHHAAHAPIRLRPPVYTAFATQRMAGRPALRRVDATEMGSPMARAYTGSVLGAAAPVHLPPPTPMVASYVNPVVVPPGR